MVKHHGQHKDIKMFIVLKIFVKIILEKQGKCYNQFKESKDQPLL